MNVTEVWKYFAISAMGILIGATPTYFGDIRERPSRTEVSQMISKEAPSAIAMDLRELVHVQTEIKIEQAKLATVLEGVLNEFKREHRRGRD